MSAIMNLKAKGNTYKDGLTMITTYKSLRAKLEGEISPLWAVTPILAVYDASEDANAKLPDLGLSGVLKSFEKKFDKF